MCYFNAPSIQISRMDENKLRLSWLKHPFLLFCEDLNRWLAIKYNFVYDKESKWPFIVLKRITIIQNNL